MFQDPQNMAYLNKLTDKIMRSENPGVRGGNLVDVHHVVDGNDVVSFLVYDKEPSASGEGIQHERRWVVVVTLQDETVDAQSWTKTRGIVSLHWEDAE